MVYLKEIKEKIQKLLNLRKFLNEEISLFECRELIRKGIMNREINLLTLIKKTIYENKKSPYLELLKLSHIDYEDIKKMISQKGIEETLKILKDEGVYITFEEFKGAKTIKRKGQNFYFKREDFCNPFLEGLGEVFSGATTGMGIKLHFGIEYLMQRLVHEAIVYDLHGLIDGPRALWLPPFPAVSALLPLRLQKLRIPPVIWFTQVKSMSNNISLFRMMISFLRKYAIKNFLDVKFPPYQYVGLRDAYIVTKWAADMINKYSKCIIHTYVSSAVRICAVAKERGLNIAGTKFSIGGESLTAKKRKEIEETGCKVVIQYFFTEGGIVGSNCDNIENKTDEIHFFKDNFAVIQNPREIQDQKINLFLFTSFYWGAPIIMLNMENGDCGVIEEKKCGCALDQYGFFDHMYNIRSYEKMTSEGIKFYTSDIINIIETKFPEEFGGSSIDYQVVEEEDKIGLTRLNIYVNPEIRDIDEKKAKQLLFDELNSNLKKESMRSKIWKQTDIVIIKRAYPLETPRGKIFLFYQNKK